MAVLPIGARYYYPRCIVNMNLLLDDGVGGFVPASFTNVVPRSVEIERNSARKADTCRVELDYRDLPLDPRAIKDIQIFVHIENMQTPSAPLVPTDVPGKSNLRFIGSADSDQVTLGSSEQTVTIEARDYTAFWLNKPARSLTIPPTSPGVPLSTIVDGLRLQVTPETTPAIFAPGTLGLVINDRTGKSVWTPASEDDNAWDVLSGICDIYGLVPVWNLDQLEIRSPSGPPYGAPARANMLYGYNVEELQFSRNLKQPKSKQVKLVAWNPELGESLEALWPPTASAPTVQKQTAAKTAKPTIQQVQYNVEGPYTPASLLDLATKIYDELSQSELRGKLKTRDLTDATLPISTSLLDLQNGDQLVIKLGTQDQASIAGMSQAEAIAFLSNPLKPNNLTQLAAGALVAAWSTAQTAAITFYVLEVRHRWHREDGYDLEIGFRDFILGA